MEDKALCSRLTFWERRVCLYDQALVCYCLYYKAHAWLIDIPLSCPYLEVEYLFPNHVYTLISASYPAIRFISACVVKKSNFFLHTMVLQQRKIYRSLAVQDDFQSSCYPGKVCLHSLIHQCHDDSLASYLAQHGTPTSVQSNPVSVVKADSHIAVYRYEYDVRSMVLSS